MPTVKTRPARSHGTSRRQPARKEFVLREESEDGRDARELLATRTRDTGVRYSTNEARAKIGLPPLKR